MLVFDHRIFLGRLDAHPFPSRAGLCLVIMLILLLDPTEIHHLEMLFASTLPVQVQTTSLQSGSVGIC